jgi:large subunit ribosomal protein L24
MRFVDLHNINMKIKKGDKVKIIAGKDRGKEGKILQVLLERNRVIVEGLNLLVKHVKPRRDGEKGQRIQTPGPLNISNVMLVCPNCNRPTKIGHKILEDKKKVRVCKKCKEIIS